MREKGCSLTEVLIGSSILLLVIMFALPNIVRAGQDQKESEVKANIHSIQIALERYAVDSGGIYPYILYGGDITDTFAVAGSRYYQPSQDPGYHPFPGDCDVLLQFGYLPAYPQNPFNADRDIATQGKILTDPYKNGFGPLEFHFDKHGKCRTNIWATPYDRGLYYVRREVGGEDGTLMWDVSEGQRHAPWPVVLSPMPEEHWSGFRNPRISINNADQAGEITESHQFWTNPGNFYYYGVFEGLPSYSSFIGGGDPRASVTGWVTGYRLVGYGDVMNLGGDVYNLWGDFEDRSLNTVNEPLSGFPTSLNEIYVGPDGRPDGVTIVVDSGVKSIYELEREKVDGGVANE